jgi:hypothetical protein
VEKGGERAYEGLQHLLRHHHISFWGPERKRAMPADELVFASEVASIRDVAAQWGVGQPVHTIGRKEWWHAPAGDRDSRGHSH